jgi:hypothetical protein
MDPDPDLDPDPYWSTTSNPGYGSGKNEYGSNTLEKIFRKKQIGGIFSYTINLPELRIRIRNGSGFNRVSGS